MKVEKFKVLLYLKKSGLDKFGKAPIMGRITVNNTMAQFSCKLSCTPELWNPRESRLNGKSKEAVDVNAKIDRLLLSVNSAFDSLVERKIDFDATAVKELLQGSVETQITLLKRLDMHIEDMRSRIGIDVAKSSMSTYIYTRRYLGEFIQKRFKTSDVAFGQLNEHIPWEFQDYILKDKGLAVDTARHYLAILKKICRMVSLVYGSNSPSGGNPGGGQRGGNRKEDDMQEKPERGQEPGKKENPQESMPPDMPSGGSTENSSSEGGGSL